MSLSAISSTGDSLRRELTFEFIENAAKSLAEIFKTSYGAKGTFKMLVSGSGDLRLTKDGNVLLGEMSIIHPVASFIAKSVVGQSDRCGDGTIGTILLISEMLNQCAPYIRDGFHPRLIIEGILSVRNLCSSFLLSVREKGKLEINFIADLCLDALMTKVDSDIAKQLSILCAEAISHVASDNFDTTMIEIIKMKTAKTEAKLVKGLILDHGGRHPYMPKSLSDCYILLLNVSLEYEKTEINSGMFYHSAEERDKLAASEQAFVVSRADKIVEFFKSLKTKKSFVIINQKGIDPLALDIFARNGILALRRAKRRNIDRIMRLCGGSLQNSLQNLDIDVLGSAGKVHEHAFGEEKFTFIEDTPIANSCTILINGPSDLNLKLMHDSIKSGLKICRNYAKDLHYVPGGGCVYFLLSSYLSKLANKNLTENIAASICSKAFLELPKINLFNSGLDKVTIHSKINDICNSEESKQFYIDVINGNVLECQSQNRWDSYHTVSNSINTAFSVVSSLLLIDEVLRAGKPTSKSS